MTISVDGPAQVITVPKADTVLTGTDPTTGRELRTYDTDTFHVELREWGDTEAGRAWAGGGFPTHTYQTNILGSITYAPTLEVLSPWRVTFEDGTYQVTIEGTNNNIHLVATVNQVQIVPTNSAGLQLVSSGSGLSVAQDTSLTNIENFLTSIEGGLDHDEIMRILLAATAGKLSGADTTTINIRDNADTKNRISATVDASGNRTAVTLDAS